MALLVDETYYARFVLSLCQQRLNAYSSRRFVLAFGGGVILVFCCHCSLVFAMNPAHQLRRCMFIMARATMQNHWAECCQRHGVMTLLSSFDCRTVHLDTQCGESIEKLARDARYAVLAKHVQEMMLLLLVSNYRWSDETFYSLNEGWTKGLASQTSPPFSNGFDVTTAIECQTRWYRAFAAKNHLTGNR